MLCVGEMDENVDPASTMQVVNALIKADKDFDLLVIPGRGHGSARIALRHPPPAGLFRPKFTGRGTAQRSMNNPHLALGEYTGELTDHCHTPTELQLNDNPAEKSWNQQPSLADLYVLFFTEMWERFSFYGMRALLVLYMVAKIKNGGLELSDEVATAIYGLYTAGVYMAALARRLDRRSICLARSVPFGTADLIIAAGHFILAIPARETFFLGLILLVLGTGMLKPNISTMVGRLYPEGGARRDAGFTIFYMGINIGAMIGPLVCSYLGEKINWHYGFGAAGVGMVLGLIQYRLFA